MLAINYKTYQQSTGKNAILLTKQIEKATRVPTIICASTPDLALLTSKTKLPVFAQHTDAFDYGAHTGSVLAEHLKSIGVRGTLLNHSENRYDPAYLSACITTAKNTGLQIIVCVAKLSEIKNIAVQSPTYIAYEPPELIGGDVSVTTRPQVVKKVVSLIQKTNKNVKILVGAGVKTAADVALAKKLGCHGVLLASGVTCAKKPASAIAELCKGF